MKSTVLAMIAMLIPLNAFTLVISEKKNALPERTYKRRPRASYICVNPVQTQLGNLAVRCPY